MRGYENLQACNILCCHDINSFLRLLEYLPTADLFTPDHMHVAKSLLVITHPVTKFKSTLIHLTEKIK